MSAQAVPFWQSIRTLIWGQHIIQADSPRRMRITEREIRTLPDHVREIRVFSGGAWVSWLGEDIRLYPGQSLSLEHVVASVAVTTIGREPVVLELLP